MSTKYGRVMTGNKKHPTQSVPSTQPFQSLNLSGLLRLLNKPNAFYLHLPRTNDNQTWQADNLPWQDSTVTSHARLYLIEGGIIVGRVDIFSHFSFL